MTSIQTLGAGERTPETFGEQTYPDGSLLAALTDDSPLIVPISVAGLAPHPRQLLCALWPSKNHCHQIAFSGAGGEFRNVPVSGVKAALELAAKVTSEDGQVYLACAEFLNFTSRKAENVGGAHSFWIDVDCGAVKAAQGKGYATLKAAHDALEAFLAETGFPAPTHTVNSGGGGHFYWVVDGFIARDDWLSHAQKLKALAKALGLLADPARTADIASVMRMPGTLNRKYTPARPVTLVSAAAVPLDRDALLAAISDAHARLCSVPCAVAPASAQASTDRNDDYGPPDLSELKAAMSVLDPDCDEPTWKIRRIGPLARASLDYPEMADDLRNLAASWSSGELHGNPCMAWTTPGTTNGVTGEAEFPKVWERFRKGRNSGQVTTLGTIYHDAALAGWAKRGCASAADAIAAARAIFDALILKLKGGDVGAPLEPDNIAALTRLALSDPAEYQRVRGQMKAANKNVSLTTVDDAVKKGKANLEVAPTHHAYASDLVARLTIDGWKPVGHEGTIYVVDRDKKIWVPKEAGRLETMVAEAYDNRPNCTRRSDYTSIAVHTASLVSSTSFFADAAIGVACRDEFHRLDGDSAIVEALSPKHRQRVLLSFAPSDEATPLFEGFLHETFACERGGEEAEQRALLQEIAGAVMLGLLARYQKAVLFYDPYGRAGKGTFESILRHLVPERFVTAVSPFSWDQPYFLMPMAGARLNVVGELPDGEPIPAAIFKSVVGGDSVTGRNPADRPVSFRNSAAHIFMSNHLITSKDHSEAFFARWLIVEFPNSRLKSGLPLDPMLAERITGSELPGIAHWALQGAKRLLSNGRFSTSAAHARLMQKWRQTNSSLDEFIFECCDRGNDLHIRRAALYQAYKEWCVENTRKAFAKGRVKELLAHNVGLGITLASLNGHEIFRGVCMKPDADPGGLGDMTL